MKSRIYFALAVLGLVLLIVFSDFDPAAYVRQAIA